MACSKLVQNLKTNLSYFLSFFKQNYKENIWLKRNILLFYVLSVLKISTFAAKLIILWPLLQVLT